MGNIQEFEFDFSKLSKETILLMLNIYKNRYKHTSINTVTSELYLINDCLLILNCTAQKDKTKDDIYQLYQIIRIENKYIKLLDFLSKINKSKI